MQHYRIVIDILDYEIHDDPDAWVVELGQDFLDDRKSGLVTAYSIDRLGRPSPASPVVFGE